MRREDGNRTKASFTIVIRSPGLSAPQLLQAAMQVARVSKKHVQVAHWAGTSGPKRLVRTPPS